MTLAFAGFPTATFGDMGTAALVLATIRAECDRLGRCRKDQRFLAGKAGLKLATLNYHVKRFERLGVITLIKHSRRKSAVIIIRPEHRWVTSEKPAPTPSECSTFLNTSSKAREEERTPDRPPLRGGDAPDLSIREEGANPVAPQTSEPPPKRTFGPCLKCGAERDAPPPTPCASCGSTRRTAYKQARAPRRPRPSRQRQRGAENAAAFQIATEKLIAWKFGTTAAPPAQPALPPPPDIIPPGHEFVAGEVIPMPRQPLPRPRGFSPATDNAEAFHHAVEKLIAKRFARDRRDHPETAEPLLAG